MINRSILINLILNEIISLYCIFGSESAFDFFEISQNMERMFRLLFFIALFPNKGIFEVFNHCDKDFEFELEQESCHGFNRCKDKHLNFIHCPEGEMIDKKSKKCVNYCTKKISCPDGVQKWYAQGK